MENGPHPHPGLHFPVDELSHTRINGTNDLARQLITALPVAIYTCDKNGYIQLYSAGAVELWGREPMSGKDLFCGSWKIYNKDGLPLPLDECPMAVTLREGKGVPGEEIIIEREDGTRRNVVPHPFPIFDEKGNVNGAVNMVLDITKTKVADEKSATLAAIIESSEDAIISKTLDGIITSWNEGAGRIFGYTASEMIGKPVTVLIPPDRLNEEPGILERLKSGEKVEHFETVRLTKDKRLIDISLTISPIRDENGHIIGASKIARDISKQKMTESDKRDSEERFRMAIESTNLGTWEYFPGSGELSWSDECRRIYGAPVDLPITYEFFSAHIHPDDAECVGDEISKAMDPLGDGNYEIQYRILRYTDKQPRWIRTQGRVFFNSAKKAERFIGTVLDITEAKEREQKLKDSVELFTTMADNVPAMIWMSGDDKHSDFFNKTWLEFTGRSNEEESNEGWLENVHPDDVEKCIKEYAVAFNQQKGIYTEYRLKRHDGQYRWIADNSVPRYNENGKFVGFISACMDIDDQKKYREKIRDSELLFKTISSASPAALWMTDSDGQNVFVNETWISWTGKPFEQQLMDGWLKCVVEEDRNQVLEKFAESSRVERRFRCEFRFLRNDGELRWGLSEGYPYYDSSETFSGYAGSITDITELKKLEQRKDDFIKMASHELKTPITSIKGYVQLLLNIYDELNEEKLQAARPTVRSALQTISKQVSKLTRLVTELLDLSRIESAKLELNKSHFDLSALVEETVQDIRQTTLRHAIIVNSSFEGTVYADKDRISQVLMNLFTNAIKYSPSAESIEVSVSRKGENAVIRVKDKGIGIDKKDHQKIFERFYRVEGKSEQTYPGFGIGLFIASEIIQRHHGMITVESEKGKGSEFIVTLPIDTKDPM